MTIDDDLGFVGGYLTAPPRWLGFPPRLERRFAVVRARRQRRSFYFTTLATLIALNLSTAAMIAQGMMPPDRIAACFLDCEAIIVLPVLASVFAFRRFPTILLRMDLIAGFNCLTATLGLTLINRELPGAAGLYNAFSLSLVPMGVTLLSSVRFAVGAPMSLVTTGVLIAAALSRPDFPPDAKEILTSLYAFSSLMTLIVSHRGEHADRLNFLWAWRERQRLGNIERANLELAHLSRTDGLTGLANRREFDARFAAEAARARASGKLLALVVLDIDHFKLYNDRLGHPQGDRCIRGVARALAEAVGPQPNFAGRIGGEEFAAVLPGASVETAAATAQRIRSAVEALQTPHPALGERRVVSISLGVACLNPARPETPEALMSRADAALYRAKRAGRDRAEVDLRVVGA